MRNVLFAIVLVANPAGAAPAVGVGVGVDLVPALAGAALTTRALAFEPRCCTAPPGWQPIAASRLASQRGGFDLPSGLSVSLGIERLVAINGQLVAQSNIDFATIDASSGQTAHAGAPSAQLVQIGAGNFASLPPAGATFIQNSLNDQTIGTRTIINASVNSASLLKDLNFNGAVRDAGLSAIPIH